MKVLTKEEEQAHYKYPPPPPSCTSHCQSLTNIASSETLKGGGVGGAAGLTIGVLGVYGAGLRYPAFRHITLPLRAFLVTSSATFGGTSTISQAGCSNCWRSGSLV